MNTTSVRDIELSELESMRYDLGVFATGYESRCACFAGNYDIESCRNFLLLEFEQTMHSKEQRDNREKLEDRLGVRATVISDDTEEETIYRKLRDQILTDRSELTVLVDYSSMRRSWYCLLLNYFRSLSRFRKIRVDFVYSQGSYKGTYHPRLIDSVSCLPGCEGGTIRSALSIVLLGLGFDPNAPYYALENLEPDKVFAYIASPGSDEKYFDMVLEKNELILSEFVPSKADIINLPIGSVQRTFQSLWEISSLYLDDASITLIPFGPKPHVLASILLSMKYPQISCFYVKSYSDSRNQVEPTGAFTICSVEIS